MRFIALTLTVFIMISCNAGRNHNMNRTENNGIMDKGIEPLVKTKEEWRSQLTDLEYNVMIEKGTERPYTGEYWNVFLDGVYKCAACGFELFDADTKYDANCGWPSFFDSIDTIRIKTDYDYNIGYRRTEIMCAKCGAHLGHVFEDGPKPTGLRYCVNSASIKLDTTRGK